MLSFIKYGSVCRPAAGFYLIQVPQEASRSAAAWAAKRHCRKNDVHKSTKKKKNTAVFVAGCRVRTHSTARYSQGLIQGYCNLSFVSQGNFGSMNASPAWGRCVTPQNESEEEKKIARMPVNNSELIVEWKQSMIYRPGLSTCQDRAHHVHLSREKGWLGERSKGWLLSCRPWRGGGCMQQ